VPNHVLRAPQVAAGVKHSLADWLTRMFTVLSALVLFSGIVNTEAYYAVFGVRYQTLQFPATHMIYRGVISAMTLRSTLIPMLLAILWFIWTDRVVHPPANRQATVMILALAAILIVVLDLWLARESGIDAGISDTVLTTTTLPHVETVSEQQGTLPIKPGDLVLWFDSDEIVAFTPLTNATSQPIIKRVQRKDVHEFTLARP
jgi:hypothetical protein